MSEIESELNKLRVTPQSPFDLRLVYHSDPMETNGAVHPHVGLSSGSREIKR